MRCTACDAVLNKYELTHTNPHTNAQEELCNRCLLGVSEITDLSKLPYYDEIVEMGDCC